MAKKPVIRDTKVVDPLFYIPKGMDGWEYVAKPVENETSDDSIQLSPDGSGDNAPPAEADVHIIDNTKVDGKLRAPSTLSIVSQKIRRNPDGSAVVDIILDIEDVPGNIKYEIRVTKI